MTPLSSSTTTGTTASTSFYSNTLLSAADKNDPKKIAGLFEAMFYRSILSQAREENSEDSLLGGYEMSQVQSMFDDELANHMGMTGHLGIANIVMENFQQAQDGTAAASDKIPNLQAGLIKDPSKRIMETL